MGTFVEVLGKKFRSTITVEYFAQKIRDMEAQFGNRSRSSAKGVDWKALSHAVRVINEVEELLDDGFITFPLKNREYIKSIKYAPSLSPSTPKSPYTTQRVKKICLDFHYNSILPLKI